jgi:hypothetical protein
MKFGYVKIFGQYFPILSLISSTAAFVCEITKTQDQSSKGIYFSRIRSFASNAVVFPLHGTACKSIVSKFFIKHILSLSKWLPLGSSIFSA